MQSNRAMALPGGLAGWLMSLWRASEARRKEESLLELKETLSLGGRRQLMLVRCGGQHFLIGAGVDQVQTIVEADSVDRDISV